MPLTDDIETAYPLSVRKMTRVRDVRRLLTDEAELLCSKSYAIPEPEIDFIAQVIIHLAEAGFGCGPRIVPTRNGSMWMMRKGKPYMITNWVSGRSPDFDVRSEWKKALRTLAAFHLHAEGAGFGDIPPGRDRFASLQNAIADYRSVLTESAWIGDRQTFTSLCDEAIRYLADPRSLEAIHREMSAQSFVHGDYNYPNLVLDRHNTLHLIDFENTSLQVRMTDLVHILQRNFAWNSDETLRWIEYYDRIRPLSGGDRHLLFALLHVPYPLIRAIRMGKSRSKIAAAAPPAGTINHYVKGLAKLL
jgi:Ser/Thr protein kinase RdoA (MazF antagonist)